MVIGAPYCVTNEMLDHFNVSVSTVPQYHNKKREVMAVLFEMLTKYLRLQSKGRFPEKKVALLLDFVQMRGGRALPKYFVHFSQTVYIGSIWGWGERGRSLPNLFGPLAFQKVAQVVQIKIFGKFKQGFLSMKLIQSGNFWVQGPVLFSYRHGRHDGGHTTS